MTTRCAWADANELYQAYHDREWGVPVHDDRLLFEFLILEGAQAGLSWETILKKRENYRHAYEGFDPARVAAYGEEKSAALLADAGIVRNRAKVAASIRNARAFAKALQEGGFRIVSGGTDSHVLSVDLRSKGVTGKEAEAVLGQAGITVNKNTIPFDPEKPFVTSGVRLGTPAVTTRAMQEKEMGKIAGWISAALEHRGDPKRLRHIRGEVEKLCSKFPIYRSRLKK